MIKFNVPLITGLEKSFVDCVVDGQTHAGDGIFDEKSSSRLKELASSELVLLTPSCTHALELAAILCNIKEGDEVIMPSYTFVSTANAFALRGARIVFVDVAQETMNLDLEQVKRSITSKTKVIVPVHYAGTSCDMDVLKDIAYKNNIVIVEDAAQAINSYYKNSHLGSIGDIGCLSFHETKNIHCGEGGALLVNNKEFIERAEIIRQKGTNRKQFLKGIIDKYTWVELGSSYLMNELSSAFLYGQLENVFESTNYRLNLWNRYRDNLLKYSSDGNFTIPSIPDYNKHNAHIFYIKLKNLYQRNEMIEFLRLNNIEAVFHYIPLHTSNPGLKYGVFSGEDKYTTSGSEQLIRLPLNNSLSISDIDNICDKIVSFFEI